LCWEPGVPRVARGMLRILTGRPCGTGACWENGRVGRAADLLGVGDVNVPSPLACSEGVGWDWVAGGGLIVGSAL
jgi:hypothetical protein